MAKGKRISKGKNIKKWKMGINNVKDINIQTYPRDERKGIRL